jgi:hypothetical protein
MRIRFALAVGVALLGISVSGMAQQKIKVKHTAPDKTARKTAAPITKGTGASTTANSKDLRAIEQQTARTTAPRTATKKSPGAAGIKPIKDKPMPSMNLGGGGGGGNNSGSGRQGASPYKGRLKQKYSHQ